jgi:hypothetical protein
VDQELEVSLFSRGYQPAPAKMPFFDAELARIMGRNPYGEPKGRVVWGCDERTHRAGNASAIKYPGPHSRAVGIDRWILEVWRAPEFFGSPEDWERLRYMTDEAGARVDLLGEYPSRGMYVMVMPVCTKAGDYLEAGAELLKWVEFNHVGQMLRPVNSHSTLSAYAALQRQMLDERAAADAAADEESEDWADHINTRGFQINQERAYSLPPNFSVTAMRRAMERLTNKGANN